jgi:hypothetical protein
VLSPEGALDPLLVDVIALIAFIVKCLWCNVIFDMSTTEGLRRGATLLGGAMLVRDLESVSKSQN